MIDSVWAAEQSGSSGMPQFQTEYFSSQLFWATVSFAILFYLVRRFILPTINRLLDERAEHIRQETQAATALRETAEKAVAEHGQLLEQLQQNADSMMQEVRKESLRCRDEAIAQINAEHHKCKKELLAEIECARRLALKDLQSTSVDIAMAATERLMSKHIDRHETEKAVHACVEALKNKS